MSRMYEELVRHEWEQLTPEQKREKQKAEAINRMTIVDYFKPSINEFKRSGKVMLNEFPMGAHFYIDEEKDGLIKQKIDAFEAENHAIVYAVTHTLAEFGECYEFFFVSDYPEEWDCEKDELKDGYQFVWVYNHSVPWCSEFGSISFRQTIAGGLRRIG